MANVVFLNRLASATSSSKRPFSKSAPSAKDKKVATDLADKVSKAIGHSELYVPDPRGSYASKIDEGAGYDYTYQEVRPNDAVFVANDGTLAEQQRGAGDKVTASSSVDSTSIQIDDARQGYLIDCYFVAAIGAIASLNPNYIEQMIRVDEDARQWIVSLRDVSGQMVDVRVDMTIAHSVSGVSSNPSRGMFAYSNDTAQSDDGRVHELWPAILEKAYAALRSAEFGEPLSYANIEGGGGQAEHAFQALTGSAEHVPVPNTLPKVMDLLRSWCPYPPDTTEGPGSGARKPTRPITLLTTEGVTGTVPESVAPPPGTNREITGWHAYVLRRAMIDVSDPNDAWINLHNPHGSKHLVQLPVRALIARNSISRDGVRLFNTFVVGGAV